MLPLWLLLLSTYDGVSACVTASFADVFCLITSVLTCVKSDVNYHVTLNSINVIHISLVIDIK